MVGFLSLMTAIGGVVGFFIFIVGSSSANGAPQEAAAASMGMAAALIPYVLLRVAQLSAKSEADASLLKAIKELKTGAPSEPSAAAAPTGLGSSSPLPQRPPA